jgi:hypothetical protein
MSDWQERYEGLAAMLLQAATVLDEGGVQEDPFVDRISALVADRDGWKRAAESQNKQWSKKCTALTEERARGEALQARINDLEDDFRTTVAEACGDPADDRQHCACVPHLRRQVHELEGARAAAKAECLRVVRAFLDRFIKRPHWDERDTLSEVMAMLEQQVKL